MERDFGGDAPTVDKNGNAYSDWTVVDSLGATFLVPFSVHFGKRFFTPHDRTGVLPALMAWGLAAASHHAYAYGYQW